MKKLKKVIIPIAGLGTRMLPATKAIPKEMLPVAGKPIIQYVVEEAVDAGFKEIIFITHSSKSSWRIISIPALNLKPSFRKGSEGLY